MLSTHLSGDEVQGIVLGSRPLFLSGPSPPGAPLRPHGSSKILCLKTKPKKTRFRTIRILRVGELAATSCLSYVARRLNQLIKKVHYLLATRVSTSSSLRISPSSCVSLRLSRAHLPTCAPAAFTSRFDLMEGEKSEASGLRINILKRRTFSWGVGRFPCIQSGVFSPLLTSHILHTYNTLLGFEGTVRAVTHNRHSTTSKGSTPSCCVYVPSASQRNVTKNNKKQNRRAIQGKRID